MELDKEYNFLNRIIECDLDDSTKSSILNAYPLSTQNCVINKEFAIKYLSFLTDENKPAAYEL